MKDATSALILLASAVDVYVSKIVYDEWYVIIFRSCKAHA